MPFYPDHKTVSNRMTRKELSRYQKLSDAEVKKASFILPGSLTVEASIVLPLFLMVISCFFFLFDVMRFQICLQNAMDYAAEMTSACYYAVEQLQGEEGDDARSDMEEIGGDLVRFGITAVTVRQLILNELNGAAEQAVWLKGGNSGLILLQSRFPDEDGAIDLVVSYQARIPFLPGSVGTVNLSQRSRRLVWSGTIRWKDQADEDSEVYVYVTANGSVYHRSLECTYLKRNITEVMYSDLSGLRNESGGRYYPCERCVDGLAVLSVYITDNGDRYHKSLNCSSLTRTIQKVLLAETSLPACSKCKTGEEE